MHEYQMKDTQIKQQLALVSGANMIQNDKYITERTMVKDVHSKSPVVDLCLQMGAPEKKI